MSNKRIDFHNQLVKMFGSNNVYYQPPQNTVVSYPCIVYSTDYIKKTSADDASYKLDRRYQVIVISKTPDHPVIEKLLALPSSSHSRHYVADNLNHDVLSIYY